jgi:hypothetical protein
LNVTLESLHDLTNPDLVRILLALLYIKIAKFSISADQQLNLNKQLEEYKKNKKFGDDDLITMAKQIKNILYPSSNPNEIDYKETIIDILKSFTIKLKEYSNQNKKEANISAKRLKAIQNQENSSKKQKANQKAKNNAIRTQQQKEHEFNIILNNVKMLKKNNEQIKEQEFNIILYNVKMLKIRQKIIK